jgi:soluble lytic murein transglycosylase
LHAQGRDNSYFDDTILEMGQAYRQHDRKRLSALLPQVRGYVLEPWAAYWELSARLEDASPAEIQEFLTRFAGSYQEDRLRNEWLLVLGRNRDWVSFNREYPKFRMNDDRSVRCYALLADHLASGADVNAAVAENWLALKDTDEGCASAAEQLIDDHSMTTQAAWQRARIGMESDRLRVVVQAVGLISSSLPAAVNAVYLNPAKYLNDKLTAVRPKTRELVSLALIRLAWLEPVAAAKEVDKLRWRAQLTQEERNWIWGAIGKRAAQKGSDDACAYFGNGKPAQMHDDHLAWMVRAALRAGRWDLVLQAIDSMSGEQRSETGWLYWRARAMQQIASSDAARSEARKLMEDIAGVRGYYEQLALEELGQAIAPPEHAPALTQAEKDNARANIGLSRALYAIQVGLRQEGVREWNYSTNLHVRGGMEERDLLAAADLACHQEVWDRCINTSERTKSFIEVDQRFPLPFKSAVLAHSRQVDLDPAFVYGLIRQESRFIMDAHSPVGATGLMQIMPATARWTARKIGLENFRVQQLSDRETNISIGTAYLKLLLDSFGGSMPLAAAAYNAGPSRSRAWRGQAGAPLLETAIWIENIPFSETRDYVRKVLSNTTMYAALLSGQAQSLKARLGKIGPPEPNAPTFNEDLP